MLSVKHLSKIYKIKGKDVKEVRALDDVTIDFPEKGLVFLLGKSGSGKSTLLNTVGGLDTFNSGEVIIKGKSSKQFKQRDFDAYRNTYIGFIFQEYNILNEFTVGKNLALALELQGKKAGKQQVDELLDQVDLHGYYKRRPDQLSGGQKQRVAIARALIKDPEIIMADEPTGALDSNTGRQVMETLKKLSKTKLVIIVSHDREFAEIYGDRVVELKDGKVISDVTKHVVEAERSESGVSFIDDKIIHIKKGQKINKTDLLKINKMIVENTQNEDTIISFDQKPNEELKRVAFITDEGNREVFKQTTDKDLDLKNYDPKKFKLIKSKMKLKDAFKMGASSLKTKPIRLIFTILLSFIAFAMFGITDTIASFNVATSTYESMKMLNNKNVAVTKVITDGDYRENRALNDADFNKINGKFDYNYLKVIYSGASPSLNGLTRNDNSQAGLLDDNMVSGIVGIDNNVMSGYNLQLEEGNLPQNDDEICISHNLFRTIKTVYNDVETLDDINEGSGVTVSFGNGKVFKICGIIKDDTDLSKYQNATFTSNDISSYMLQSEVKTVLAFGLVNMCYVTPERYAELLGDYKVRNNNYNYSSYKIGSNNGGTSFGPDQVYNLQDKVDNYIQQYEWQHQYDEGYVPRTSQDYIDEKIEYKKAGVDLTNLSDNQVIISKDYLSNIGLKDEEDIGSVLNDGYKIKFYYTYNYGKYVEYDVVAISKDSGVVASKNTMKNLFGSFDYALARLKNTNQDKELVDFLLTKNNDISYNIQFAATPTLDSFSNMIVSMSQAFLYVGIALAVFAGFMLMNFISTSISYKKREIGVLRAIGAGKKDVFMIFFSESFVIAVINFILAAIGCIVACFFINRGLYQDLGFTITLLTFGIRQILLLFAVSVGVAFVSTFLPVWRIAKKNPIDSINNR